MKIQDKLYFPISEPIQSFDEYMDQSVWDIFWEQSKANLLAPGGADFTDSSDETQSKQELETWINSLMYDGKICLRTVIIDDEPMVFTIGERLCEKSDLIEGAMAEYGSTFDYLDINEPITGNGTLKILMHLTCDDSTGSRAKAFSQELREFNLENHWPIMREKLAVNRLFAPLSSPVAKKFVVESSIRRYIGEYKDDSESAIAMLGETGWPLGFGKLGI